jgi:hypothetical protein
LLGQTEGYLVREVPLPPNAPALLASLRAIGYSFDSALADIVDNSLAAGATRVDVWFPPRSPLYVAVVDDGLGMSAEGLIAAMQHGGVGPDQVRADGDLGRFGLGLKTASFSQCKRLTVATLQDGRRHGAVWDLDRVKATGDWTLLLLDEADIEALPHVDQLRAAGHGTLVLWAELDRALAGEVDPADALGRLMDKARSHMGLVYHRWIAAEPGQPRIALSMNGLVVDATDPFLTSVSTEQPSQGLTVEGSQIRFTPYILPHRSRLSKKQLTEIDGEDGLRRSQGFYVYRQRRLITSGTWFRLMRQGELTKLARVRVDIPNALDHLWQLDVKKSTATPPHQVRQGLQQVIQRIGQGSERVISHRGWKEKSPITRLWDRLELPSGVNYTINRDNPAIAAIAAGMTPGSAREFDRLLEALELTIPFEAIYADIASERDLKPETSQEEVEEGLKAILEAMVGALAEDTRALDRLLKQVPMIEPFSSYPDVAKKLLQGVRRE